MSRKQARELARMNKLRELRGLEPLEPGLDRAELFARVAGARCIVDRCGFTEERARQLELSAFMAIFHPDVSDDRVRSMLRSIRS